LERYLAVAYWAGRKEDASACATRASRFLLPLLELSTDLAGWRETGKSKEEALANQIYEPQALADLEGMFAKGFSKRAVNHVLWNGKDENYASTLNMRCGVHSTVPTLGNAVVLNLPHSFDVTLAQDLRRLAAAFADAWEPDWMAVTSQTKMNECGTQKPFLDKALYVKSNVARPSIPVGTNEEKLSQGTLFLNVESK
jgi:hypothetical protein